MQWWPLSGGYDSGWGERFMMVAGEWGSFIQSSLWLTITSTFQGFRDASRASGVTVGDVRGGRGRKNRGSGMRGGRKEYEKKEEYKEE